jgi:hypothetical protein
VTPVCRAAALLIEIVFGNFDVSEMDAAEHVKDFVNDVHLKQVPHLEETRKHLILVHYLRVAQQF